MKNKPRPFFIHLYNPLFRWQSSPLKRFQRANKVLNKSHAYLHLFQTQLLLLLPLLLCWIQKTKQVNTLILLIRCILILSPSVIFSETLVICGQKLASEWHPINHISLFYCSCNSLLGSTSETTVACAVGGAVQFSFTSAAPVSRRRTNDQQLQEIKEVVEEAELAQTMIHSLAQTSGSSIVTSTRNVTGSSSITSYPLQRVKGSQLHDRWGQVEM